MDCEEIRLNLLAYLDGEVGEDERATIEAHLAGCPDCAAELERLQALQADLWDAVPLGLEPVRLPDAAEARIRANLRRAQARQEHSRARQEYSRRADVRLRRSWTQVLGDILRLPPARQPLALARAAIPLLVALCFLVAGLVGRQPAPVHALETIVLAPQTLAPDTDAALRVIVRRAESAAPVSDAEVRVVLQPTGGEEALLYSGHTGSEGTADVGFRVPEYIEDRLDANLVVTTVSPLGESVVRQTVVIKRSFRLLLGSDKPLYQPGQAIHLRVLVLDALLKLPAADRPVTFTVHDPSGRPLLNQVTLTSAYGIAATDYDLAADAPAGAYRLAVELGDTRSERTVTVGRYERPRFRVSLDVANPYYLAGEVVEARVSARTFDEQALPGVNVALRAYLHAPDRTPVATMLGRTDGSGVYAVSLTLPADIPAEGASLSLEASATDAGGLHEWAGRVVPVAIDPLAVDVVAESGRLRPGVENVVYFLVARPDGAPAHAQLDVEAGGRRYTLQTDAYGLATLRLRPEPGVREVPVQIAATDAEGRVVRRVETLSADQGPAQVLLRLDRATYQVGGFIRAEVLASQDGLVYLDVVHSDSGQALSTHLLTLDGGRATLDLDVPPQMAGTIELHAYQVLPDGTLARDARLAVVDAPTEVFVDLRTDRPGYRPGDTARVIVHTSVDGVPVHSALGVAVVDESVFALEERAPGFAKLYFVLEKRLLDAAAQPPGVALADLFAPAATDEIRAAQDQAARAAWARLPAGDLALARSEPSDVPDSVAARARARLQWLGWCLSIVLLILSLGQWAAVVGHLRSASWQAAGWRATATRRTALRRSAIWIGGGTVVVLAPLTVLATLGLSLVLNEALSRVLLAALSISWLAALFVLGLKSRRRREEWTQIAVLLAIAHGLLGALLAYVAGRGGDPGPVLALAVTVAFAAALLAWLLLAAGWWVERRRDVASLTVIVVLLSVALVVLAGRLDLAASPWMQTVGDPQVYAGPAGWLMGCAPKAPSVEKEKVVKETVVVEKEVEKVVEVTKEVQVEVTKEVQVEVTKVVEKEVTKAVEVEKVVTPTAAAVEPAPPSVTPPSSPTKAAEPPSPATPAQAAQATPTAAAVEPARPPATPGPPPPLLGQYVPETLYWAPEALTDEDGRLAIDILLPDTPATWRMTILASTLQGELGSAEAALLVLP